MARNKTIRVTLPAGLWECAQQEAVKKGNGGTVSQYVTSLMRKGLRALLSQAGYKTEDLDKT